MIAKDICYPWRTPAPLLAQRFIHQVFRHAGTDTQIVILNRHPFHYSVLLAWQLATAPRPFLIHPDHDQSWLPTTGDNLWLVHFHFSQPEPISPEILRHFQHHVPRGKITADITRRLFEPFSGHKPVYMQAVHIAPQP
ncbi:MAG: hypothetical protein ACYCUV_08200 [Phycisphaerae bacterium]